MTVIVGKVRKKRKCFILVILFSFSIDSLDIERFYPSNCPKIKCSILFSISFKIYEHFSSSQLPIHIVVNSVKFNANS